MLDVDGTGSLEIEEFCDGILEVMTSDRPIELKRIEKVLAKLRLEAREVHKNQRNLQKTVDKAKTAQEGPAANEALSSAGSTSTLEQGPTGPEGHSEQLRAL